MLPTIFAALQAILLPALAGAAIRSRKLPSLSGITVLIICCTAGLHQVMSFDSEAASARIATAFVAALLAAMVARITHLIVVKKEAPLEGAQLDGQRRFYHLFWGVAYLSYLSLA